jgi:universal stress protein A
MKAKKIVFPTDFSESGQAGLAMATSLARDTGATLVIVHVEEAPLAYGGGDMYYGVTENLTEQLRTRLETVKPSDPSVPHEHHLLQGDPGWEIVQLADEVGADMIVIGTHGRTGLSRMLMGSVAEAVVRRANCPVLTVKQPMKEEKEEAAKSG